MNAPDHRLRALLTRDDPPARDQTFESAVAARIARRRWFFVGLEAAILALTGLAVGWAAWPFVAPSLERTAPLLTVAALLGLAVWSLDRTFERALFGGYEDFTRDLASE